MATMNVSLPERMKKWVEERVASGPFANASDYVRDLVRRDEERTRKIARFQAEVDKGIASGVSDRSIEDVFADAKKKGRAALKKRDAA
jgi:antitoxin ParD1/3/4